MIFTCHAARLFMDKPKPVAEKILEAFIEINNDYRSGIDYSHLKTCGSVFVECEFLPCNTTKAGLNWRRLTPGGKCFPSVGCEVTCTFQRGRQ